MKLSQIDDTQYWGQEPLEILSEVRAQICLNGAWHFLPLGENANPAALRGELDWGTLRLPAVWSNPISWAKPPELQVLASGSAAGFASFDPQHPGVLLYRRSIQIPAGWAGREILFEMHRDVPEAEVIVNGISCGRLDEWHDSASITAAVRAGETADLRLFVKSGPPLAGDAFLTCRPQGAHIRGVFVQPSVRYNQLRVQIELAGVQHSGEMQITARLYDEAAARNQPPERIFFTTTWVKAGTDQLQAAWDWPNPRLWDLQQPNLYRLELQLEGCGLADTACEVFGFREFWIEGRHFFLNGSEIRLRPVMAGSGDMREWIDGQLDGYLWAGYNLAEIWPGGGSEGSSPLWYERADRKGFLLTAPVGHFWAYVTRWADPAAREEYRRKTAWELRRIRNHPSIVLWGTNANVFGSGLGMDPRTVGIRRDAWYETSYYRKLRAPLGEEIVDLLKQLDPTRPVFTHHGGGVGDVYTLNMYLNLTPLQEREEWLSAWAQQGELPFMVVEFGTPLHVSFMRARTDFPGAVVSEPLLTEYCAIYLGCEAYRLETPEYRAAIRSKFEGGQRYASWHMDPRFDFAPPMQAVQALFSKHTWRAWRSMGITGGMIPWTDGHGWGPGERADEVVKSAPFQPGRRGAYLPELPLQALTGLRPPGTTTYPAGQAIRGNNQAVLAWLCAQGDFTNKDHHFTSGQSVRKAIAVLNDTRQPQEYSGGWQASLDGQKIACGKLFGLLPPGKTAFLPLEFTLPATVPAGTPQSGEICFTLDIAGQRCQDVFNYQVFAPQVARPQIVHLYDPEGDTRILLESLGCSVQDWQPGQPAGLVIIGRRALSGGGEAILPQLEAYVRGGGRVLIFAQEPGWVQQRLGWRVAAHLARRVFAVQNEHPALAGLANENLRDWNGASSLVEERPENPPEHTRLGKWWFPYHGYHWGNQGAVSSAMVEKPHRAGWRPVLEGEFDLAYTPLMELDYGQGWVIWCSLDLEARLAGGEPVSDLAAQQLAANLIGYAQNRPVLTRRKVYYSGSALGATQLDALGLVYTPSGTLPPAGALLVLGPGSSFTEQELLGFLRKGGRLFVLPHPPGSAPLGTRRQESTDFCGALALPAWPECAGLSLSDLRWRAPAPACLLAGAAESGAGALEVAAGGLLGRLQVGQGCAIFCQLDPQALDADHITYLRLTRWRQTRAITQLLANLGAEFAMDGALFRPANRPKIALDSSWQAALLDTCTPLEEQPARLPDTPDWREVNLPTPWDALNAGWAASDNDILLQKRFDLPAEWLGQELFLSLGKIDDCDLSELNGVCISELEEKAPWPHNYPRVYRVPAGILQPGQNSLRILLYDRARKYDRMFGGGLCGPASELYLTPVETGWYHPDFRPDYVYGDDPYRYFNW